MYIKLCLLHQDFGFEGDYYIILTLLLLGESFTYEIGVFKHFFFFGT